MNVKGVKFAVLTGIVLLVFAGTDPLHAQTSSASLSGVITSSAGSPVPNAKVSIKNQGTGQSTDVQTDSNGKYSLQNLSPGDYEVSVTADGFSQKTATTTLSAGLEQKVDLVLPASEAPQGNQAAPSNNLPNAPSSTSKTEPSLNDLGFPTSDTQGNAKQQALLDKRTHMLKIHQRMGLITTAPLIATIIISANAGGKSTSSTDRTAHLVLGAVSGDLYFITAYYALRAPRVPGTKTKGPIRFHKAMAWIHGPGMILTPILGAIAYDQKSKGEKVHGIASAHGPVAIVTAGAFGAALLSVSMKF